MRKTPVCASAAPLPGAIEPFINEISDVSGIKNQRLTLIDDNNGCVCIRSDYVQLNIFTGTGTLLRSVTR